MSPDLPTNLPTSQLQFSDFGYLSVRLTLPHDNLQRILDKLCHDQPLYCIYKHTTGREHFHVCLPGLGKSDSNRITKRLRDNFGLSGNGGFSTKSYDNGLRSFVFYSGHEGNLPTFRDARWDDVIASCTEFYVKQTGQMMLPLDKTSKKDQDADWQLTYSNMVSKAINHARRHALTGSLKEVLQHMMESTKWRPSFHLVKNGVPDHYYKDFEFRSGKRQKFDMGWMDLKF